jgi:trans-aconitate methyltransferase
VAEPDQVRALVERAWDEAALGYDAYFGPRFAPYLGAAIGALLGRQGQLPSGSVLVPCVGPGRELPALALALAPRPILASDLSRAMVARARERAAAFANVSVVQADATALVAPAEGAAALLSAFGLQLLPEPASTLGGWVGLLAPGALAAILYWPRESEAAGPFHSMRALLRQAGLPDGDWEAHLATSAVAAGGRVLADTRLCFEMEHEDARSMWRALTHLGPLRALMSSRGEAFVAELGEQFAAEVPPGALRHTPAARLLLIERS